MEKENPTIRHTEVSELSAESSADKLLRRPAPHDYIREWENSLSHEKASEKSGSHLVAVLFRIGKEFFAIPSLAVGQVTAMRTIHRIPHQKGKVLRGCVNINGQLRLFISLMSLFDLGEDELLLNAREAHHPLLVIERDGEVWTFAVSEVLGIHQLNLEEMKNVPVTISKSAANYLKGVISWKDHSIGILDEELLFFSLRKNLR